MGKKNYIVLIIIVIVVAILVLTERIAIPCIFHELTGFYCPGCGATRATKALVRGDVYTSFRNNILIYIVVPLIFILKIIDKKIFKDSKKIYNFGVICLLILTICFGVLRNIPMFSFLAPIEI